MGVCSYCIFFAWILVNTPQACLPACLPVITAIPTSTASFIPQPKPWHRPHKEIKRGLRPGDTVADYSFIFVRVLVRVIIIGCQGRPASSFGLSGVPGSEIVIFLNLEVLRCDR